MVPFIYIPAIIGGCFFDLFFFWLHMFAGETGTHSAFLPIVFIPLWRIICWIVVYHTILYAFHTIYLFVESWRTIGRQKKEQAKAMKFLAFISSHYMLVRNGQIYHILLGCFGIALFVATRDPRALSILLLAIVLIPWLHIRISAPPYIHLSASNQQTAWRNLAYKRVAMPLRVVNLLDMQGRIEQRFSNEMSLDCMRTENEEDWWGVVEYIAENVPLIVIDASVTTSGVQREFLHLLEQGLEYKTICLMDQHGEMPLFSISEVSPRELMARPLCMLTGIDSVRLLELVRENRFTPTPDNPLSCMMLSSGFIFMTPKIFSNKGDKK